MFLAVLWGVSGLKPPVLRPLK